MEHISHIIAYIILILFLIYLIKQFTSTEPFIVINEWDQHISNFSFSTLEFYDLLIEIIQQKKIEGVWTEIIKLREGGFFSPRRFYLKVSKNSLTFLICSIQFGEDNFMTYRLGTNDEDYNNDSSDTKKLFQIDSARAFQATIQKSIQLAIEIIQQNQGFRLNE